MLTLCAVLSLLALADPPVAPPAARPIAAANINHLIRLPDSVKDINGAAVALRPAKDQLMVLAMTSATCPISRKYAPRLGELEARFKNARFVYISASPTDSAEELRSLAKAGAMSGPLIADADRTLAASLGATTTAEVFVIDSARTLLYRGAIDDQYALGASLDSPRHTYLVDALNQLNTGSSPRVSATTAPGCLLEPSKSASDASPTTYSADISRIVQNNCLECHRTGGVAPFTLDTFEKVSGRSRMIRQVVEQGIMPPWFAAKPSDGSASRFANDRSLSDKDRGALLAWIDAGTPRGNPDEDPLPARVGDSQWTIGKPDAIISLPQPIEIKATGTMPYQMVRVKTDFGEDKWVSGIQVLPTAPSAVHHVLVFIVPELRELVKGGKRPRENFDEARGFFGAYVPGSFVKPFPDGFAKRLPKGATLVFQLHYTPNGEAVSDQTKLGLTFAKEPPRHIVRVHGIANHDISIPPNDPAHVETAAMSFRDDVRIMTMMPHMHVRGKSFAYDVHSPGEPVLTLLDVPRYDFNWQLRYELREPLLLKAGTQLEVAAVYDNSEENPNNPAPDSTIGWGPQTTDEMLIGYVEYYLEHEDQSEEDRTDREGPGHTLPPRSGRLFRALDKNHDGKIERDEVPQRLRERFDHLDGNHDGVLDEHEWP